MKHLNLLYIAIRNGARHKLRNIVVILCIVAVVTPFISAIAILEGVKAQSRVSVSEGADIYLTMDMFGRNGIIPIQIADEIKKIDGVIRVAPRIIGRIYISGKLSTVLGITGDEKPSSVNFIRGSLPKDGEVVIGRKLADYLKLDVGKELSLGVRIAAIIDHDPFIMRKMYRVSGVFDSQSGIWASNLVMMNIDEAASMFEMEDFATDIAVYVRPGYEVSVSESLQKMNSFFRIQTKGLVKTYVEKGFNAKGGIFAMLYMLAFALAIPAILVTSGFGLSERRKEIGVLKATGWHTHEVLEMIFFESIMLALISAPCAFIISFAWVKVLNAPFIAQLFISGIQSMAPFQVPAVFMPLPFVLSFFFALVLTMVGSIYSTWRAAIVPPAEALK
ncbi:MAG: FtsX-like permease family protein [Nitrospirae bacterium]|nr:FtsX-like permease family protein [Nitrospirota bacterium]